MDNSQKVNLSLSKPVKVGAWIFFIFIFSFGLWANFVYLSSAIIVNGFVKVDTNKKKIQHLEGGIVKSISVKDGELVKVGDTLIELDTVQAKASLAVINSALYAKQLSKIRLVAEMRKSKHIDFTVVEPGEYIDQKKHYLDTQHSLFEARQLVQLSQQKIIAQQIEHLHSKIKGLDAQKRANTKQINISKDEVAELKRLRKRGLVDKSRVLQLDRDLANLQGQQGDLIARVAITLSSIDEKKLEIIQLNRNFHENVVDQLQEVEQKIMDLKERQIAAKHTLTHMRIIAPVNGVVVGLQLHTVNGVIGPGQVLMEIVPQGEQLIIEGKLSPTEIDNLSVGLNARVKFSGLKHRTTSELNGKVKYVSADSFNDERTGEVYFIVKIEVGEQEVIKLGDQALLPGMPAEVFIQTGERTPLQYLLQPLSDNLDRAWRES